MSRLERKKSLIGWALIALGFLLVAVLIFQNWQAAVERDAAQSSAQTSAQQKKNLAEEVAGACQAGQVVKSSTGEDLCARAADIAEQPVTVEGPQGPVGPRGFPGSAGADGRNGVTGPVGPAGKDGAAGTSGINGSTGAAGLNGFPGSDGAAGSPGPVGPPGPAGADGAPGSPGAAGDPGPAGPPGAPGTNGTDGAPGPAPQSFTFADATGTSYTCVPVPPGSLTYTCTSASPPLAPVPESLPATPPGG